MPDEDGPVDELPEAPVPSGAAAMALALDRASRAKADAFLDEQTTFVRTQKEHLHEQRMLVLSHMRWRRYDDWLRAGWQTLLAVLVTAVAIILGVVLWKAVDDHALVIESFSVPPDLAARGLTGQTVAAQLLDKLQAMQDATDSARPADSYANNWGDDIKVEIPETGVSIGEVHKLLVSWLGHETHITGEVYRTATGLAITARAGGNGGATVTGKEAGFDTLLQETAENIYQRTQPYRYAAYIQEDGVFPNGDGASRLARAKAILQEVSLKGPTVRERAWATLGLGVNALYSADVPAAVDYARKAVVLLPNFALGWMDLTLGGAQEEHEEQSLIAARHTERLVGGGDADISAGAAAELLPFARAIIAFSTGDLQAAAREYEATMHSPGYGVGKETAAESLAMSLALLHESRSARTAWQTLPSTDDSHTLDVRAQTEPVLYFALADWQAVLSERAKAEAGLRHTFLRNQAATLLWPYFAAAMAETGDVPGAEALIGKTPLDCDLCLRVRGRIAALKHDWTGANRWFAMVTARTPSIPFAATEWGRMLMTKGDFDGAIAKFALAHQKGPHFADPLEMWGEALILKNRSDLALAKFAEAAQYAPNWGRLHLKWGEALLWSGKKDAAQKQFAIAAKLDLADADRRALTRLMGA